MQQDVEDWIANSMLIQAKYAKTPCKKWRKRFTLPDKSVTREALKMIEMELQNLMPDSVKNDMKLRRKCEYIYFCERQPLGKQLFEEFCAASEPSIKNACGLLRDIRNFEIANSSRRREAALYIVQLYLCKDAPNELMCLSQQLKTACTSLIMSDSLSLAELNDIMWSVAILDEENSIKENKNITSNGMTGTLLRNYKRLLEIPVVSEREDRFRYVKILLDKCKYELYPFMAQEALPQYRKSEYFETFLRWKWKEKEPVTDETFLTFRVLGAGGFGEVHACQVRCSGKFYACKKLDKKRLKKHNGEAVVMAEKRALEMVHSPFVVNLIYAYESKSNLNLVMTLMDAGDLGYHIYEADKKTRGLTPERVKFYAAQITLGLDHLHKDNILHRDLKPSNVLLDEQGNVRIADLGLACILEGDEKKTGKVGTPGFMAPEILQKQPYAFGIDWFALGVTIFEMTEGRNPFSNGLRSKKKNTEATKEKTIHDTQIYKKIHENTLTDIIDQLLIKDVAKRLGEDERSAEPIKCHPYFSDANWERLEAKVETAPFVPEQGQIYAKNLARIRIISQAKGVQLIEKDRNFHQKFATGRVSIPWQQEMIETELYHDVRDRKDKPVPSKSATCSLL